MENEELLMIESNLNFDEGLIFFDTAKSFFEKNYNFVYNNKRRTDETSLEYNARIREEATELDSQRDELYQQMINIFEELDNITQAKVSSEAGIDLSDIPDISLFKDDEEFENKQFVEEIKNNNSDMYMSSEE